MQRLFCENAPCPLLFVAPNDSGRASALLFGMVHDTNTNPEQMFVHLETATVLYADGHVKTLNATAPPKMAPTRIARGMPMWISGECQSDTIGLASQ